MMYFEQRLDRVTDLLQTSSLMYMEALGAQGTSIVKLFSPILWHTQACVGSFYMLEFPVLLLCRFLFQSSRSYLALKAILAAGKKWSQGENSQLHSSRIGKRAKHNYFLPFQQRTSYLFRCQSTES